MQLILDPLQTTHNKLIRFVLDVESRAHISKEQFELLNWLPVNSRVDHLFLLHIWENKVWPCVMLSLVLDAWS